jgi:phosphoribosyl-dephospho-CoA transferase
MKTRINQMLSTKKFDEYLKTKKDLSLKQQSQLIRYYSTLVLFSIVIKFLKRM